MRHAPGVGAQEEGVIVAKKVCLGRRLVADFFLLGGGMNFMILPWGAAQVAADCHC